MILHFPVLYAPAEHPEDKAFDNYYPPRVRRVSRRYWTPVSVAETAARWLVEANPTGRVIDVGSGAGKFCIVGALCTSGTFVGVEQRMWLVRAATSAAEAAGVAQRVSFRHERATADFLSTFSAFYLFNPFEENLYGAQDRLDATVELSRDRHDADIQLVERVLAASPEGTRVVTYHGFGGRLPGGFEIERSLPAGSDSIRLWVRRRGRQ